MIPIEIDRLRVFVPVHFCVHEPQAYAAVMPLHAAVHGGHLEAAALLLQVMGICRSCVDVFMC